MVVPLQSVSRPGHSLEGTRLTLVRVPGQPDAVEFSIRTPVTPPRWVRGWRCREGPWFLGRLGLGKGPYGSLCVKGAGGSGCWCVGLQQSRSWLLHHVSLFVLVGSAASA